MLDRKRQLIEELLNHLDSSQGSDLQALIEASKKPTDDPMAMDGKPKGLAIEKVSVMGKPGMDDPGKGGMPEPDADDLPGKGDEDSKLMTSLGINPGMEAEGGQGDDEMSDDELKELLEKYLH